VEEQYSMDYFTGRVGAEVEDVAVGKRAVGLKPKFGHKPLIRGQISTW
jgi:hypothetical protein